jgi:ectoine hydroxylase-related dioxygenase (phytanoyl-CoA dioxygenase family)
MKWTLPRVFKNKLTRGAKAALRRILVKARHRQYRQAFDRDGFLKLPGFCPRSVCAQIVSESEEFYKRQGVAPAKADRTMNLHQESPAARMVLTDQRLLEIVSALLGAPAVFLQSIYFNRGSEQNAHSDYIYMSTNPDFHVCGFWMACEDIAEDSGPLIYYPGSHKLPIQNVKDRYRDRIARVQKEIQEHETELLAHYGPRMGKTKETLLTCFFYDCWLEEIHAALKAGNFQQQTLLAKKGDVLIWHTNLVHGGSPVKNKARTRKSLVAHYLTEAVVEYFDMNYVDSQNKLSLQKIDHHRPAVLQVRP